MSDMYLAEEYSVDDANMDIHWSFGRCKERKKSFMNVSSLGVSFLRPQVVSTIMGLPPEGSRVDLRCIAQCHLSIPSHSILPTTFPTFNSSINCSSIPDAL